MNLKELRELFGFTCEELGQILEVSSEVIRCWEEGSCEIKNQLAIDWLRLAKAIRVLVLHKPSMPNFAKLWLRALNPLLGGISPRDLVKKYQRILKLAKFLENAYEENYVEPAIE